MISKVLGKILLLFKIVFISIFVLASVISLCGYFATLFCNQYSTHFFGSAQSNLLSSIIIIPFTVLLIFIIKNYLIKNISFELFRKLIVIIICLKITFVLFYYSSWKPFSDFEVSFNIAKRINDYKNQLVYRSYFPEWCNYITFERLLCQIGLNYWLFFVMIENIFSIIIAFFIMKYSLILTDSVKVSYLSCILYLYYPTTFFYSFIFKPDTISLMLALLASIIFAYSIKYFNNELSLSLIIKIVFAIILIVIGNRFKPIATIFAIAFFIVYFINCIKNYNFKKFLFLLILVLMFIVTNNFTNRQFRDFSEKTLETNIDKDAAWHYLCVGLNLEGEGQIHIGNKSRFYTQTRAGHSYKTTIIMTKKMLLDNYTTSNIQTIFLNFAKKTIWFLQDDVMPILYFNTGNSINVYRFNNIQHAVYSITKNFDLNFAWVIYLFILVLSIKGLKSIHHNNLLYLYNNLCIFGFFLMLMISEAQSRYKSNIMPFVILLASNGMFKFLNNISE